MSAEDVERKCYLPQDEAKELGCRSIRLYVAAAPADSSLEEEYSPVIKDILCSLYAIGNCQKKTKKGFFDEDVRKLLPKLFQRILTFQRVGNMLEVGCVWDILGCFCCSRNNGNSLEVVEYLESQSVLINDMLSNASQSLSELVSRTDCGDSMDCANRICRFLSTFAASNSHRQRLVGSCPALIRNLFEFLRNFSRVPHSVSCAVSVTIVNIHGRILQESSHNAEQLLLADGVMVLYSILGPFVSTGQYLVDDTAADLLYKLLSAFTAACQCVHTCAALPDVPKIDVTAVQVAELRGLFCTLIDSLPSNFQLTQAVVSAVVQFSESCIRAAIKDTDKMVRTLDEFVLVRTSGATLLTRMFRVKNHPSMSHLLDFFLNWFGKIGAVSSRAHKAIDLEFDKQESGFIEVQGPAVTGKSAFNSSSASSWDTDDVVLCGYPGCMNSSRIAGQSSMKKCSKCKKVYYCGKEHQLLHWKSGHKQACAELTASGV